MNDNNDDSTVFIKDIKSALKSTEEELGQRPAALLIVGGEMGGRLFDLKDQTVSVGRNPDNVICLDFKGVSRYHFKLTFNNNSWLLEDVNSRNGTFLNDQKLDSKKALEKGDIIKVGAVALKYIPQGDPERLSYDKLQWEANRDLHTGCYNKAYFNNALNLCFKKAKLTDLPLSLIILDLDHFKKLNDNYGHDAGDYVLKEMVQVIKARGLRANDIFARYGGEEFVILLPQTELQQAFSLAQELRKSIEDHDFSYEGNSLTVTASIGVADYRKDIRESTDLFKRADQAVYKAKSEGRNNVQVYSS